MDLIKILCLLFLELGNFEEEGVNILAENVSLVGLLGDISLEAGDVNLLAGSLVTSGSEVLLHIGNNAALLIYQEGEVIGLLLQADDGLSVGVVLHAEFVVLQQLYFRIRTSSPTVNLWGPVLSASTPPLGQKVLALNGFLMRAVKLTFSSCK